LGGAATILLTRILKGKMNSPLRRLNPPNGPMHHNGSTSNLIFHLQTLNLPKEKIDLVCPTSPGIPSRSLHRRTKSTNRKGRRKIPNIEPHLLPIDDLIDQLIGNILGLFPLAKLQPGSPDYIYLRFVGMGFQMEKILEKIKVELNPQESLTQMNIDRDVKN
jgi:hypothetical protein